MIKGASFCEGPVVAGEKSVAVLKGWNHQPVFDFSTNWNPIPRIKGGACDACLSFPSEAL